MAKLWCFNQDNPHCAALECRGGLGVPIEKNEWPQTQSINRRGQF